MSGGKVSVILVGYNGEKFLDKAFRSILAQSYPAVEAIYVDNASKDNSLAFIRHNFPTVKAIAAANKGFGIGCNVGVAAATGEYLLFLNEDMHLPVDFVKNLVETYEHIKAADPQIGALGCTEDHYDGRPRDDVTPGQVDPFGYTAPNAIQSRRGAFIPGCPFFITRALFSAAGGFCPNVFLYGDDIDLSWRLINMGKHNYTAPEIRLYHYGGASMEGFPPKKIYYLVYGATLALFNNYSPLGLLVFLPLNVLFNLVVINLGLLIFTRGNLKYNYAVLTATAHFFWRLPRLWAFRSQAQKLRTRSDWQFIREHMIWRSSFIINKSYRRL